MRHAAILVVLAIVGAAVSARAQTGGVDPRIVKQSQLDQLIETIRKTDNASTAVSAYAKGQAIDPRNSQLNNVYLRRMLQLGLPQITLYPAQVLAVDEPDNGLAWAVVGYAAGKKNDYPAALAATVRALGRLNGDASCLNNAGQLLAWFDAQESPPALSEPAKRIIAKARKDWEAHEDFQKGYERLVAVLRDRQRQDKEAAEKFAAAQKSADEARKKLRDLEVRYQGIDDDIAYHKRLVRNLRWDYWQSTPFITPDGVIVGDITGAYRERLLLRIAEEERAIDNLNAEGIRVRRDGREALAAFQEKQAAAEQLRKGGSKFDAKLQRAFRWDPPAVDGVVTPEVESFPQPKTAGKPATLPSDPATDAQRRLELARLYLVNDLPRKATDILQDVVSRYPGTSAAQEAKQLLGTITKDDDK